MTSGFGGQGHVTQESRALSSIGETAGLDQGSGEADFVRMLQTHDYQIKFMAGQLQKAQKGINEANQNPIQQIQQFVADIIVLLGGGELAKGALDFGDLQYILPALGALFGFGEGPFPLSLFAAAQKFFFGYVVPQQQFIDVINQITEGWLNVFGIDPEFIADLKALNQAVGDLFGGIGNLLPSLGELFGALGIDAGGLGPLGQALGPIIKLFSSFDLTRFGDIVEFITDAISPFIEQLTAMINWVNGVLAVLGFGGNVVNSPLAALLRPFQNLISFLGDINFGSLDFNPIAAAVTFIQSVLEPTGLLASITAVASMIGDAIQNIIRGLTNGSVLVNAANLIGSLAGSLFSFVPSSAIGHQQARTPFVAGGFPGPDSLVGNDIWSYDPAVSRTADGSGSAKVTADGTFKALRGAKIAVAQGQKFEPAIFVEWSGYTGTGAPVQLHVVKFNGDTQIGITTVKTFTPPAASSFGFWAELTGSYLVEENVTGVCPRLVLTDQATAGTLHFDGGGYRMKSNLMSNLTKWLGGTDEGDLFGDPDTFDPTDLIPEPFRDWIGAVLDGLQSQAPKDQPWADLINSVLHGFGHIPDTNVLGVLGPDSIGASIRAFLNQYVGGSVGAPGDDASLPDAYNVSQDVSSRATLGSWSWDILGIRSNKPLGSGFLPTSESPVSLDSFAFGTAPTFAVTQSASTIEWHRFSESGAFGAIGWQGEGNASLTGFYVNIWKMDTATGDVELVHRSANILGDISPALPPGPTFGAPHVYEFVDAGIMREPGDVFGAELTVVGAGAHTVAGAASWLPDQLVFPRRFAATRNSGTGAPPSTIASGSVVYSPNVPFIEFGVDAGSTPIPHQPQTVQFNYDPDPQTTVVPSWGNWVDLIPIGAGAGGSGALFAVAGARGRSGKWNPLTLQVGVDIKPGSIITVTVGRWGGAGGGGISGSAGEATVITYIDPADVVHTLTAAGGTPNNGPSHIGEAAGDVTVAGVLYRGGGSATFYPGSAPGGGGGGAMPYRDGYRGAPGGAWVVSRQN